MCLLIKINNTLSPARSLSRSRCPYNTLGISGRCGKGFKICKPTACGRTTMEHQYTQTGSLVRAILGASLSEAKTDNVGKPQYKSGAPHPPIKTLFSFSCCHLFLLFFLFLAPAWKTWKINSQLQSRIRTRKMFGNSALQLATVPVIK